jgi:hypothetical protein
LKTVRVNRMVERDNLFMTLVADHLLPFTTAGAPWFVVLPALVDPGVKAFKPVDADELRRAGRVETADWLDWADKKWQRVRKKSETQPLWERLDYLGQLSSQAGQLRYVVLYTSSGGRPVAAVLDARRTQLPFVARDKTYWASFAGAEEAHFLSAFLNSTFVHEAILDWMTKGLFGPRDIHKRVLDVPWPTFDPANASHSKLVAVSNALAKEARQLVEDNQTAPASLGRRRSWLRESLNSSSLASVETLVTSISESVQPRMKP